MCRPLWAYIKTQPSARPQWKLKERDIDILDDPLLWGASHVSQRKPPLPLPSTPNAEPTLPPLQTTPPIPPPSIPPMPMSPPHTWNGNCYSEIPQTVLPLREVSGPEGSIRIHVPFTVNDIRQCREKLRRYTENPNKFMVKFQILALLFDLTWRDIQFLLTNCCTPTERKKILLLHVGRQMRSLLGIP
jgi:hypothetical protein